MTDSSSQQLGELQARCHLLEARVAALTAFACAMLESNPRRDELLTRWSNLLGPALEQFSSLDEISITHGSFIPTWVDTFPEVNRQSKSEKPGP